MILSPAGLFRQVNFVKGGHTMKRGDVSFTFLNRIEEVELNIKDERWQSALALALTLPDICGGIAFPDIVKRYRDGRVMLDRQKNLNMARAVEKNKVVYGNRFDDRKQDFANIFSN